MIKGELHPKKTIIKNDYKNRDKFENPKKKTLYNTRKFSNASKLRKYNTERNSRIDTNYKGEKKNSNSLRKKCSSKKRNNIRNKNIIENKNKEKEIFERNDKFKRQRFNENYIVPRINPKIQVKPKLTLTEILMPDEQNSNPTFNIFYLTNSPRGLFLSTLMSWSFMLLCFSIKFQGVILSSLSFNSLSTVSFSDLPCSRSIL